MPERPCQRDISRFLGERGRRGGQDGGLCGQVTIGLSQSASISLGVVPSEGRDLLSAMLGAFPPGYESVAGGQFGWLAVGRRRCRRLVDQRRDADGDECQELRERQCATECGVLAQQQDRRDQEDVPRPRG